MTSVGLAIGLVPLRPRGNVHLVDTTSQREIAEVLSTGTGIIDIGIVIRVLRSRIARIVAPTRNVLGDPFPNEVG